MQLRLCLRYASLLCAIASWSCLKDSIGPGGGSGRACSNCDVSESCDAQGVCWPSCTVIDGCDNDHECDTVAKICTKTCERFGVGCGCFDSDNDGKGNTCDTCNMLATPPELDTDNDGKCNSCALGSGLCVEDPCPSIANQEGDADGDLMIDCKDACNGNDSVCDLDSDGYCVQSSSPSCSPRNNNHLERCPGFDDALDADTDGVPDGCDRCPGSDALYDSDNDGFCTNSACCDRRALSNSCCNMTLTTSWCSGDTGTNRCVLDICPGVNDRNWNGTTCCNSNTIDAPDRLSWNVSADLLKSDDANYYPGFGTNTVLTNNACMNLTEAAVRGDPNCDGVDGMAATSWFVRCGTQGPGELGTPANSYRTIGEALIAYKIAQNKPSAILVASESNASPPESCTYGILNLDKDVRVPIYGGYLHDFSARDATKRTKLATANGNQHREIVKVDLTDTGVNDVFLLSGFLITSQAATADSPSTLGVRVIAPSTGTFGKLNLMDSIVVAKPGYTSSVAAAAAAGNAGLPGCAGTRRFACDYSDSQLLYVVGSYRCKVPTDTTLPDYRATPNPGQANVCNGSLNNYGGTGCYKRNDTGCVASTEHPGTDCDFRLFSSENGFPTDPGGIGANNISGGHQGSTSKPNCLYGPNTSVFLGSGCDGAPGAKGTKGTAVLSPGSSTFGPAWKAAMGGDGGTGQPGSAGGGGAGGLYYIAGLTWVSFGQSGTSGAGAGVGGQGGRGGSGAGGSFPIITQSHSGITPTCTALIAQGGARALQSGGPGGDGGAGGLSLAMCYGLISEAPSSAKRDPGRGGNGGFGGGGGGGAGGDGGHSVCMLSLKPGDEAILGTSVCMRATPGAGGAGGDAGANGGELANDSKGEKGRAGVGADVCSYGPDTAQFHKLTCSPTEGAVNY